MYAINGNDITLTKGDSFYLNVNLTDAEGHPYEPQEGDVITFTLKKSALEDTHIIQKTVPTDTMTLYLQPSETKIAVGSYVYDIEINKQGDIYTFIPMSKFTITAEVG